MPGGVRPARVGGGGGAARQPRGVPAAAGRPRSSLPLAAAVQTPARRPPVGCHTVMTVRAALVVQEKNTEQRGNAPAPCETRSWAVAVGQGLHHCLPLRRCMAAPRNHSHRPSPLRPLYGGSGCGDAARAPSTTRGVKCGARGVARQHPRSRHLRGRVSYGGSGVGSFRPPRPVRHLQPAASGAVARPRLPRPPPSAVAARVSSQVVPLLLRREVQHLVHHDHRGVGTASLAATLQRRPSFGEDVVPRAPPCPQLLKDGTRLARLASSDYTNRQVSELQLPQLDQPHLLVGDHLVVAKDDDRGRPGRQLWQKATLGKARVGKPRNILNEERPASSRRRRESHDGGAAIASSASRLVGPQRVENVRAQRRAVHHSHPGTRGVLAARHANPGEPPTRLAGAPPCRARGPRPAATRPPTAALLRARPPATHAQSSHVG